MVALLELLDILFRFQSSLSKLFQLLRLCFLLLCVVLFKKLLDIYYQSHLFRSRQVELLLTLNYRLFHLSD